MALLAEAALACDAQVLRDPPACPITPKIGSLDANLLRPSDLEAFYRSLNFCTAQKCHNVLGGALRWAIRNERLSRPSSPTDIVRPTRRLCADHDGSFGEDDDVRPVPEKAIPKPEEVQLLVKDAHARRDTWWWLYLVIATVTGARPGEICALRRRDVDPGRHTIRIERSADKVSKLVKQPKSAWSTRTLKLSATFFETIAPHLPDDPETFLFPSAEPRGRQPGSLLPCKNSRSVARKLERRLDRLGLPHYTPHALRHYVATHMLADGCEPMQLGRFLGHRDDRMVHRLYGAHVVGDAQKRIGEAASRLLVTVDDDDGRP